MGGDQLINFRKPYDEYGSRLQIIVVDNTVPRAVDERVRIRLSEVNKLIPAHLLG